MNATGHGKQAVGTDSSRIRCGRSLLMRTSPTSSPSSCNAQRLRRTASSLIAVGGNSLVIRLLLSGLLGRLDSLLRGRRGLGRLFGVLVLFIILNRLLGVVLAFSVAVRSFLGLALLRGGRLVA